MGVLFKVRCGRAIVHVFGTVHWHPADAIALLRFLERERPEQMLVELPHSTEDVVREGIQRLLPIEHGFGIGIPFDSPGGPRRECAILSVTDSVTMACRWAIERGVPWRCIDARVSSDVDVPRTKPYDWDAWWGLEPIQEYADAMNSFAGTCPMCASDCLREEHMAAETRAAANERQSVALVCGAAHARRIVDLLCCNPSGGRPPVQANAGDPYLCRVDAILLLAQYLGPIPRLGAWLLRAASNELDSFTPDGFIEKAVGEAVADYRKLSGPHLTQRELVRFWRLTYKGVMRHARRVASAAELLSASQTSIDEEFTELLSRRLFGELMIRNGAGEDLPVVRSTSTGDENACEDRTGTMVPIRIRGTPPADFDYGKVERLVRRARSRADHCGFPDWDADAPLRKRWASCITDESWSRWYRMTALVQELATAAMKPESVVWRGGRMKLDCGGTIRAWLRGRDNEIRSFSGNPVEAACDEHRDFCPTVWIFEDDECGRYSNMCFITRLGSRHIYHSVPALAIPPRRPQGHYLAALCNLAPWAYMNNDPACYRRLPGWIKVSGCRVPQEDPWARPDKRVRDPLQLRPYEHLIRVAIQCAQRRVIVVSDSGNRITPQMHALASARGVKLIELDIGILPRSEVSALRDFRFCQRLVEDIE